MVSSCSGFARHYYQNRYYFLFLRLLRYFSSPRFLSSKKIKLIRRILHLQCNGFPHSETHGSSLIYSFPWRFAVNCVLHRLLVPRHPLCALSSFDFFNLRLSTFQRAFLRFCLFVVMVGLNGLEPPTSRLSGVCSNQLSYRPLILKRLKY